MREYRKIVSWDPGLRQSGIALWEDGKLTDCDVLDTGREANESQGEEAWVEQYCEVMEWLDGESVEVFVFEQMQTRKSKPGAHSNLIELSIISGMIAGALRELNTCHETIAVPANTWTKGRGKEVNAKVGRRLLDNDELRALRNGLSRAPKKNHKEIFDAVGIGLFHLRRWM